MEATLSKKRGILIEFELLSVKKLKLQLNFVAGSIGRRKKEEQHG